VPFPYCILRRLVTGLPAGAIPTQLALGTGAGHRLTIRQLRQRLQRYVAQAQRLQQINGLTMRTLGHLTVLPVDMR